MQPGRAGVWRRCTRASACLALLALLAVTLAARPASARELSVSYSTWIVSGQMVTLRFILPAAEAQRLTGSSMPLLTVGKLEDYMLGHVSVRSAAGACPVTDQGYDLGRVDPLNVGAGLYGFEIFFHCDDPAGLVLHDGAVFDRVPGHVNFARIQRGTQLQQQLFTASRQRLAIPDTGAPASAGTGSYLRLGGLHILGNLDRWCLLGAVLLLVRRRRELGYALLGLAAGYALSLAQALAGWVVVHTALLEAFVGFLVVWLAAQALVVEQQRPQRVAAAGAALLLLLALIAAWTRGTAAALMLAGAALLAGCTLAAGRQLRTRPGFWVLPTAVFGFLDGLVLPAALLPMQLQRRALWPMLAGFDAGALLAAAAVLLILAGALAWSWRRHWVPPRPVLADLAAAALGGLGLFWLVSRVYA